MPTGRHFVLRLILRDTGVWVTIAITQSPLNHLTSLGKILYTNMAFFGLTQLGYQDAIREHMKQPIHTPQYIFRSGMYRDKSKVNLPPIEQKDKKQASIVPTDQLSGYGPGHQGSYVEFTKLRKKHIRNPKGRCSMVN